MHRRLLHCSAAPRRIYNSVLDTIDSHIALIDQAGVIIFVNEAWRLYSGLDIAKEVYAEASAHADELCAPYATVINIDPAKLPAETRIWLGNAVSVAGRADLGPALRRLAGKTVRVDPVGSPVWFTQQLRAAGATVAAASDPCLLPKACKNATEQQGARLAHERDAVAVCRFLHWLDANASSGQQTEISAA